MKCERHGARSWAGKFGNAFRGMKAGVRGQSSFFAHLFVATAVVATAAILEIDTSAEWCILLLCITIVLSAEMFNSALESLAKAITDRDDPQLGQALDIASAAVLIAALGSVAIGTIVFLNRLGMSLGWWSLT